MNVKTIIPVIFGFAALAQSVFAQPRVFPLLECKDQTYTNASIVSSTPATVLLSFGDGGAQVAISNLPPFLQKELHYDPVQAQAYLAAQSAKKTAERKAAESNYAAAVAASKKFQADDPFLFAVTANFRHWDQDNDQALSVGELEEAIGNRSYKGAAAAALVALRTVAVATNFTGPPLTLANIRKLSKASAAPDQPDLRWTFEEGMARIAAGVSRSLLTASTVPRLDNIHQGPTGDCFVLGPIGAFLNRDPHQAASIITSEPGGQIAVHLGVAAVVIDPPTDGEIAMTAVKSRDGLWVNMIEKAIASVHNDQLPSDKHKDLTLEAINDGGSPLKVMYYLTGNSIHFFPCRWVIDTSLGANFNASKLEVLRKNLTQAVEQKKLMTTAVIQTIVPGLVPHHCYAVLGYDAATDKVNLWNPHGNSFKPFGTPGPNNGYATKHGQFSVPLTEFVEEFAGVWFEGPEFISD